MSERWSVEAPEMPTLEGAPRSARPTALSPSTVVPDPLRRYKMGMIRPSLLRLTPPVLPMVLCAVLCACGATDPYIYKAKEFDRNDKSFNEPITDRSELTICYNGIGTSDGRIAEMAQEECARFAKTAKATGESYGDCPLLVPVEAHFACLPVADRPTEEPTAATSIDTGEPSAPTPSQAGAVASGQPQPNDGASGGVVPGMAGTSSSSF